MKIILVYAVSCLCSGIKSYPTLCDPMGCSPPGSSVHKILQARMLEWVAISSSREPSQPRDQIQVSYVAGGFFTRHDQGGLITFNCHLGPIR